MKVLTSIDKGDGSYVWLRSCENIYYYQNNFLRENLCYSRYYYTLSFVYDFKTTKSCFFSYCYPYTHADLKQDLSILMRDSQRSQYV